MAAGEITCLESNEFRIGRLMVQHMGQSPVGRVWNFGNIAMAHGLWIQTWRKYRRVTDKLKEVQTCY